MCAVATRLIVWSAVHILDPRFTRKAWSLVRDQGLDTLRQNVGRHIHISRVRTVYHYIINKKCLLEVTVSERTGFSIVLLPKESERVRQDIIVELVIVV